MSLDWHDGGAGIGILAAIVAVWNTVTGRSEKRTREIALAAVRESRDFALAGEQAILHQELQKDISEIKATVGGMDKKLDSLLLAGRIPIKGEIK